MANIPGSFIPQTKIRKRLAQGLIARERPGSASKPPEIHARALSQLLFLFEAAQHSYSRFVEITVT